MQSNHFEIFLDLSRRASDLLSRGFLHRKNRAMKPVGGAKCTRRRSEKRTHHHSLAIFHSYEVLQGISAMGSFSPVSDHKEIAHLRPQENRDLWVLPEDFCKKDPCNFNTQMFVSKVGNPCPTLGQHLASRILYAVLVAEKQLKTAKARFYTQSAQKLANSWSIPTPHPMESCKGLPCSSPLATPET